MPVRKKAVADLAEDMMGGSFAWDISGMMPGQVIHSYMDRPIVEATEALYYDHVDAADKLYESLVNRIDFNRILIESSIFHLKAIEKDPSHEDPTYSMDSTCGACLKRALLSDDRNEVWED